MADIVNQAPSEKPQIHVIGIYPVEITKSILLENARLEFGDGRFYLDDILQLSDDAFAEHFEEIYLVEIGIDRLDALFDPERFTQEESGTPPDSWQVAYDEKYLDSEGASVQPKPASGDRIRLAFFFHSPNLNQPLLTPYRAVELPMPTPMPERLRNLFRYVPPC